MMIIENEYDPDLGLWTAKVGVEIVVGRTPRQVRAGVRRAVGDSVEVEHTLKLSPSDRRAVEQVLAETQELAELRQEYRRRLDLVNVPRLAIAERFLACRCTMEMAAAALALDATRLQQLSDPRHYAGRRVRAVRDGKIRPGTSWPSGRKRAC